MSPARTAIGLPTTATPHSTPRHSQSGAVQRHIRRRVHPWPQLNKNTKDAAELGGPTPATLTQALHLYAHRYSITKAGGDSELNRINHYLTGAGLPWLRRVTESDGKVRVGISPTPRCMSASVQTAEAVVA